MRGVAIDVKNPWGRIRKRQFEQLGIDSVRAEIRTGTAVQYPRYAPTALLYGPSTERFYMPRTAVPACVIIGNEPDGTGESSWRRTPVQYIRMYNDIAPRIPSSVLVCAAGMVGDPTFLQTCWPSLVRVPDLVNKHYPNTEQDITDFTRVFNRPVIVGEWCWYTCPDTASMKDWIQLLDARTWAHYWFCKDNGMVPDMGVYDFNNLTPAGKLFKQAIKELRT